MKRRAMVLLCAVFAWPQVHAQVEVQAPPRFPDRGAMVRIDTLSSHPIPVPQSVASACRNWSLVLLVDVDSSGAVQAVRLQKSSGEEAIDRSAMATARAWTYFPANIGGQDRPGTVRVPRLVEPAPGTCAGTGFQERMEPTILEAAPAHWPGVLPEELTGREVAFIVALDAQGAVLWERMTAGSGNATSDQAAQANLPVRYSPATLDGTPVRSFIRVGVPVGGSARVVVDTELSRTILGD